MAPETAEVERALLALAPDERAAVIERGLLSLADADADDADLAGVEAAWSSEIDRRLEDYVSGRVPPVDADEHVAQIRAKLAERAQ